VLQLSNASKTVLNMLKSKRKPRTKVKLLLLFLFPILLLNDQVPLQMLTRKGHEKGSRFLSPTPWILRNDGLSALYTDSYLACFSRTCVDSLSRHFGLLLFALCAHSRIGFTCCGPLYFARSPSPEKILSALNHLFMNSISLNCTTDCQNCNMARILMLP
jgi:hypothetical protein